MKGLLITYFFPPLNVIASHRTYSFAKYLNNDKSTLDVLCPDWKGNLTLDQSKIKFYHTAAQQFDHNFGEIKLKGVGRMKDLVLNDIFRLNHFRGRKPGNFYREAVALIETMPMEEYDYVITSFAPLDTIHIGNYIKTKYPNMTWIVDYRDLYSQLEYINYGVFRPDFKRYEKKITNRADGFVTVSEVLKNKQQQLLRKTGVVVYNGFDDHSVQEDEMISQMLREIKLPVITHVGSLYKGERDVEPFLKYMAQSGLDQKFSCVFAIINDFDEEYLEGVISKTGVKNIFIKRHLSFNQSLVLQKHSAFLLLLSNIDGKANGYLTGKIFEYMASGKPIVYSGAVSPGFELYELIKNYDLGESFNRIDYEHPEQYRKADCSVFHRKVQAERLKQFVEKVIGEKKH